jgi:NAD+ diphosphatase
VTSMRMTVTSMRRMTASASRCWMSSAGRATLATFSRGHDFVRWARLKEKLAKDEDFCARQLNQHGRFLLMSGAGDQILLDKRTRSVAWLDAAAAAAAAPDFLSTLVMLGLDEATAAPLAAVPVDDPAAAAAATEAAAAAAEAAAAAAGDDIHFLRFVDLRRAMFSVSQSSDGHPDIIIALLSRARSLLGWHAKSPFCSGCGKRNKKAFSGERRNCRHCGRVDYPPLSPVAIVLLAAADHSSVLLVRQPRFPPNMWSCPAGFVEAGESLFDCVRREVAEELGLDLADGPNEGVRLQDSQHWPFPTGSLMLGCTATVAKGAEPTPDPDEIESARWVTPEELEAALEVSKATLEERLAAPFFVPPPEAVAHQLMRRWLNDRREKLLPTLDSSSL